MCLFFWGFSLLLLLYLTCYECSKCLYCWDTKFELFYLLFVWAKIFIGQKGYELFTSCNEFCIQALHFRNFQMRARLCSPAIISSEHTQQRIWQKVATLAYCRVLLSLSECSLGIYLAFILLFLTVNVHHKQSHQVMDFSLFRLPLYLSWDNFRISEMSSICENNTTKTPCW